MGIILKRISFFALLCSLISTPAFASDPLSKEALEKLLTGNTAEMQNAKWKQKTGSWYFSKSGQVKSLDKNKKSGKGAWHINDNSELCVQFKNQDDESCFKVVPGSDGGYELYVTKYATFNESKSLDHQGELWWICKEVLPGNVLDL